MLLKQIFRTSQDGALKCPHPHDDPDLILPLCLPTLKNSVMVSAGTSSRFERQGKESFFQQWSAESQPSQRSPGELSEDLVIVQIQRLSVEAR